MNEIIHGTRLRRNPIGESTYNEFKIMTKWHVKYFHRTRSVRTRDKALRIRLAGSDSDTGGPNWPCPAIVTWPETPVLMAQANWGDSDPRQGPSWIWRPAPLPWQLDPWHSHERSLRPTFGHASSPRQKWSLILLQGLFWVL